METAVMEMRSEKARREEFERVALVHLDILYNTALRMTGNQPDAEDLIQETFLRAYRFFDKFTPGTNCKAWLFKIMKNCLINRFRKKARQRPTISFQETERSLGVEYDFPAQVYDRELDPDLDGLVEDDVKEALELLPLEFRMAVILSDISGFSYREIAEIMDTPIGTVRSRLSRARAALRENLYEAAVSRGMFRTEAPAELCLATA